MNSVLEQYLINYQQDNWTDLLLFAEVECNNSVHNSMGFTPFRIATRQDFIPMPELPLNGPPVTSLKEQVSQLQTMWPVVRKADAHEAYKKQADKKCQEPKPFMIGDRVYQSTCFLQSLQPSKKVGF